MEEMMAKMDPESRAKFQEATMAMTSVKVEDVLHDFRPLLVVYKDGRVHRFLGTDTIAAGVDPLTGVDSKDVVVSSETSVFVRLYKPPNLNPQQKVPLLVYFHGGAFCIETASSPDYHHHLNDLSSKAKVILISVDYRLAPEHPIPTAYDDSWSAVSWIAGDGASDPWLKDYADYSRVFFAGDSAGANIAHQMAMRVGSIDKLNSISDLSYPLTGFRLNGVVLIHPFFWGEERIGSEEAKIKRGVGTGTGTASRMWKFVCPGTSGSDDPMINPAKDPDLARLGCERVLVMVAEEDALRDRGFYYREALVKSGWKGVVEVVEAVGEGHVYHLVKPSSAAAAEFMNRIVAFVNSTATTNPNH